MKEHFGYSDDSLRHLRGPIGIFIGSKTPPEIAVSIMSEVLAVKNGVTLPRDLDVAHVNQQLTADQSGCVLG
jgi:xanthine dehydrogenase accessory factor